MSGDKIKTTGSRPVYCPYRGGLKQVCETPDACAGGADCRRGVDPAISQTTPQQASKRLLDSMFDAARASRSLEHPDAWVTLITQAEDALQAMWNHFGDLSDNDMLGMPCKDALVKCRDALAALKEVTHVN